ncbi:MAG: N-acetylmuramic acid 6-phosphate etherase [Pseudomonadota bacterium]
MDTEDVDARYAGLDTWPSQDVAAAILDGQLAAAAIVRSEATSLARAADAAAERLARGSGRLIYAGAGASGRLAVQDGVELFPTYGWPHERLVYLIAGGEPALITSVEGAEDDGEGVARQMVDLALTENDVVISVAASGRTPWAISAARTAKAAGALVVGISNNADTPLLAASDHPIALPTGGEIVAGSTRMAAGTAQKIALNTLSTAIMVRLNGTYSNLMVGLASTNLKLGARRLSILQRIVPVSDEEAEKALDATGQDIRAAVLVLGGQTPEAAADLIARHHGRLQAAMAEIGFEPEGP